MRVTKVAGVRVYLGPNQFLYNLLAHALRFVGLGSAQQSVTRAASAERRRLIATPSADTDLRSLDLSPSPSIKVL